MGKADKGIGRQSNGKSERDVAEGERRKTGEPESEEGSLKMLLV